MIIKRRCLTALHARYIHPLNVSESCQQAFLFGYSIYNCLLKFPKLQERAACLLPYLVIIQILNYGPTFRHIYIHILNIHVLLDQTDPFQCYEDKILVLVDGENFRSYLLQKNEYFWKKNSKTFVIASHLLIFFIYLP